jgi:predicted DNA-binding transcriptional regulator AlpA
MEEKFITPVGVRELTGMTLAALAQLRHRGQGPRFYKPTARTVLYRRSEVIEWVEGTARVDSREYA